jgi:peptide/nickel transport system substrate-binding protein
VPAHRQSIRAAPPVWLSRRTLMTGTLSLAGASLCGRALAEEPQHALAMHGQPAWPASFTHPSYARPDAPKGGRLVQGVLGTFDSLNPFIVKGLAAQNLRGYVYESMLARGYDEPFTLYALLASGVETNDQRSYVTFTLDPRARFSDGKTVTPDDIIFSWQILRDHGKPLYGTYYRKVAKAEAIGGNAVRFDLTGADDRELPLILGLMPILPKYAIDVAKFEDTSFAPPVGSGPYTVGEIKPGDSVTFTRNKNYWGRDLPIYRGLWNFDEIRFDYYRDGNSQFEAFKKGLCDVRTETDPSRWQSAYDFPALREGRVVKDRFPYGLPKGMAGMVFNTRRPMFACARRCSICSTSNGSTTTCSSTSIAAPRAISTIAICPRMTGPPRRKSATCSSRSRMRYALTSWRVAGRRPSTTAPDATARTCGVRCRCSAPPATSSRAQNSFTPRAASR